MDGYSGCCPDQQHFDAQTPDFISTDAWTGQFMGSENQLSSYPCPAQDATGHDFPLSSLAEPPQPCFDHGEPHGWFYCLSTFRQSMFPPNSVLKEHLSAGSSVTSKMDYNHNADQQFHRNQFFVFDQTADQTTMIFSSGAGAPPVHCLSHWKEKQDNASIFRRQQNDSNMMGNANTILMDDFVNISEFDECPGSDLQSEMHEDTEELNALMYSDGDTDSDDEDEVTSTGHSPGTLTVHDKQNGFAEINEEVASSEEEPAKRVKLPNGRNGIALTYDHINKSQSTFGVDDDTESRSGSAEICCNSGKTLSFSCKKRSRKNSIRETVRTLQTLLPCGNGASPIEAIDEAINFLISLKLKAKALGFDSTS